MQNQNKNKAIIFLVFITTLLMLIPALNPVLATSVTYSTNFESGVAGTSYSDSLLTTKWKTGLFNVSTTYANTGTKSFGISGTNMGGWFNYTYSLSSFLTNWSTWWRPTTGTSGHYQYFGFYNKTSYSTAGRTWSETMATQYARYMVMLRYDYDTQSLWYCNEVGTFIEFKHTTGINAFKHVWFIVKDNLGDLSYHFSTTVVNGSTSNPSNFTQNLRIDRLFMYDSAGASSVYWDDMNTTVSSSYTPGGGGAISYGCGIDMSPYKKLSMLASGYLNLDSPGFTPSTSYRLSQTMGFTHCIETKFLSKLHTRVWGISLLLSTEQYMNSHNLTDYGIYFNGVDLGYPHCLSAYENNYTYMAIWDFRAINITINNEYPVFSFYSKTSWNILYYAPFKNNGWLPTKAHNSQTLFQNNVCDGSDIYVGTNFVSLPLTMYYGSITVVPISSGFSDSIQTNSNTYQQYDSVKIFYKINSTASAGATNYIKIWRSGIQITYTNQELPYQIPASSFSGEKTFTPMIGGTYKLCLYRGSTNVSSKTITVTNRTNANYVLWSTPNPHDKGQDYVVGYRYYNTEGKSGLLNIFPENSNPLNVDYTDFSKATVMTRVLSANTTDNITVPYKAGYGANNLIIMYVNTGALTYNEVARVWEYYTPDIPQQSNIYVSGTSPHIIHTWESHIAINIYGNHPYFGLDVYISLNGKRIYPNSYGLENTFSFWYNISKDGTYNASLYLSTTNGSTYLDSVLFTVAYEEGAEGKPDTFGNIISVIPVEYRFYVGIGVIIGFFLLPIGLIFSMITGASNRGITINIPGNVTMLLSLGSGLTGYVLTIIWGLMPWYSVFIILFALIIVLAIMWLGRNRSQDT